MKIGSATITIISTIYSLIEQLYETTYENDWKMKKIIRITLKYEDYIVSKQITQFAVTLLISMPFVHQNM